LTFIEAKQPGGPDKWTSRLLLKPPGFYDGIKRVKKVKLPLRNRSFLLPAKVRHHPAAEGAPPLLV